MPPEEQLSQNNPRSSNRNDQQLYPHYNGPDLSYINAEQPKQNKTGLIISAVITLCILLLIGLAVALLMVADSDEDLITGPIQTTEEDMSADESLGLLDDPRFADTVVTFVQPTSIEGWEKDTETDDFSTIIYNSTVSSCKITLKQTYGARQKAMAGMVPEDTILLLGSENETKASEQLSYEETPQLSINMQNPREGIEFFTKQAAYTGTDNVAYRTQIAVQWLDITELSHVTTCTEADWDDQQVEIRAFNNNLSIMWSPL